MLRLDSDDKRSPIKTLAKISNTMASIEQTKIKEIEVENVQLGSQLNDLNYMIYRREKELKKLEEHYQAILLEQSANCEGQQKLDEMEAKLLRAYEDLNRVEVERKRIEQIVKACEKNPPNNEEQIRNLETQIDVFQKLISYHQGLMTNATKEESINKKQL
jgi:ribosomal protein S24E